MSKALVHVRFDRPGLHLWAGAPEHRDYLRYPHRHLFKVEVTTVVDHDDREIEFHDLTALAKQQFSAGFVDNDQSSLQRSCEQMARELGTYLCSYYKRSFSVSVWEDGEFGATVFCGNEKGAEGFSSAPPGWSA